MENSSYSDVKSSLPSISAKILKSSSRQILGKLDHRMPLPSHKGYPRDYRGLAELMNFNHDEIMIFETYVNNITMKIYESWEIRPGSTIGQLFDYLENMDRTDIIQELLPSLSRYFFDFFMLLLYFYPLSYCILRIILIFELRSR